jgi:hypothetical protein
MKSATFGLSAESRHGGAPSTRLPPPALADRRMAVDAYRSARQNGSASDRPVGHEFPADGRSSWHHSASTNAEYYKVKYTEGPRDRAWMEQCDRNYLARLDREKQAAARKQEREAQLHEAQEKLKCEQQLKEEAEAQPKALEAARSEAARLTALKAQQSQTPATKVTLSEVSLAALHGDADAQFQLGQMYAGGLVVDRVTPDGWRCEHEGEAGLVPSQYLRTLSSAQVPTASPAGYTDYITPTSGEALGTAGIFPAATATPDSVASNQAGTPEASQGHQINSIQ